MKTLEVTISVRKRGFHLVLHGCAHCMACLDPQQTVHWKDGSVHKPGYWQGDASMYRGRRAVLRIHRSIAQVTPSTVSNRGERGRTNDLPPLPQWIRPVH